MGRAIRDWRYWQELFGGRWLTDNLPLDFLFDVFFENIIFKTELETIELGLYFVRIAKFCLAIHVLILA